MISKVVLGLSSTTRSGIHQIYKCKKTISEMFMNALYNQECSHIYYGSYYEFIRCSLVSKIYQKWRLFPSESGYLNDNELCFQNVIQKVSWVFKNYLEWRLSDRKASSVISQWIMTALFILEGSNIYVGNCYGFSQNSLE